MQIEIQRIYDKPVDTDGYRILIDRLWPRGVSKLNAHLDLWAKEMAPSSELRSWFNHDASRFDEFWQRYLAELNQNPATSSFVATVKQNLVKQKIILLYGAKDRQHNNALVLQDYLKNKL